MEVKLISKTHPVGDLEALIPEELIIYIARVSSSREDKKQDFVKLLGYLLKHKHWSPFEHFYMTFEITTSLAIAVQTYRHRSLDLEPSDPFELQQVSKRYSINTDFEDIDFRRQAVNNRQSSTQSIDLNDPFNFDNDKTTYKEELNYFLNYVSEFYNALIENGISKETARFILPQCTQTTFYLTGNIRSIIHFLLVRMHHTAQKEIRQIAAEMMIIFQKELPFIYNFLFPDYQDPQTLKAIVIETGLKEFFI